MEPVVIRSVEVGERVIEALVEVSDPMWRRTAGRDDLPARAIALLPGLERHTCENRAHARFRDELANTETAHFLEHVACELAALAGSPRSLRAETTWDFSADGEGVYRVRLGYDDDLVALWALKAALSLVEWCLRPTEDAPDVAALVARGRALRERE